MALSRRPLAAVLASSLVAALAAAGAEAQLNPYVRGPIFGSRDLRGDFVAAGCALRGTGGAGTITLAGIPGGATVKEAVLYWAILDDAASPLAGAVTFSNSVESTDLVGAAIGSTAAPCGSSMASAFAFRADVTPWVTGNGEYGISNALDGGDPNQAPVAEGASLVVLYSHVASANRDVVIYDGAAMASAPGAQASAPLAFFDATSPVTGASICFVVGDGQSGLSDSAVVNGLALAVDPFDGSDAPLGVEHWDTDTFDVSGVVPAGASTLGAAVQAGSDCLLGVATAFSVTSPYPAVDVLSENLVPITPVGGQLRFRLTASNSSLSMVPLLATINVFRAGGTLVGTILPAAAGNIQPGASIQKTLIRNIPPSLPAALRMRPLYVVTTLTNRTTGAFVDDDHLVLYMR
jgi:hypothetical protein